MEDSGANLKCRDESVGELDVDLDRLRSLCVGAGSWLGWEFFVQGILKWLSKGGLRACESSTFCSGVLDTFKT